MTTRGLIVSSNEKLDVAYAAQENLEREFEVCVWDQGIFALSSYTLEALLEELSAVDFGLFIFTPDDVLMTRGKVTRAARDNVIFELGLFLGRFGRSRCFILMPHNSRSMRLPTDLLGLTVATYQPDREDGNLRAALGPACNRIRLAMKRSVLAATRAIEEGYR